MTCRWFELVDLNRERRLEVAVGINFRSIVTNRWGGGGVVGISLAY